MGAADGAAEERGGRSVTQVGQEVVTPVLVVPAVGGGDEGGLSGGPAVPDRACSARACMAASRFPWYSSEASRPERSQASRRR
jgi:hypothetical protein